MLLAETDLVAVIEANLSFNERKWKVAGKKGENRNVCHRFLPF